MNSKEFFKMTGLVKLDIHDRFGNLKHSTGWIRNTVTTAGKAALAARMSGITAEGHAFWWLAVGDSASETVAGDTALANEIAALGLGRAEAAVTQTTTTVTNDSINFYYQWTASGDKTVKEIGIFNSSTAAAGTMLGRKTTGDKALSNTDTLTANYKIVIS